MRAVPHYLALDQGSHASKALVYGPDGVLVAAREVALACQRPRPDWVEHDAEALVESIGQALSGALAQLHPPAQVVAAGLATQRSTVVCWDRQTGAALSPVISWQDRRNAAWLSALGLDPARVRAITGLVPSAHYGASKLRWCLDELASVGDARASSRLGLGPMSSFLLFRLLAEHPEVADPANASRTLLWDVNTRDWSAEMLACFGIPAECLPRCVPSRYAYGTLHADGRRIPLTVTTGDQSAALFAWGRPEPHTCYVNLGTGAFVQRASGEAAGETRGLLHSIAWQAEGEEIAVLEGTVNGAGAALEWLAQARGLPLQGLLSQAEAWLRSVTDPPLFLNCIGGLGSPYWVADCRSGFSAAAELDAEFVAVLESILFLVRVNIDTMADVARSAGGLPARIVASGGLARLDGLCQRLADLCGAPVERPAAIEATAGGIAWLLSGTRAAANGERARFEPRHDPALQSRYRHWCAWLEATL